MKIIAHRGASGDYPENTLLAFEQAIVQGADAIELDAHYHPCGEFVLLHAPYLDTSTNGTGKYHRQSLAELKKLDAGANEQLPTLTEALTLINGRCPVNIELKAMTGDKVEMRAIVQALQQLLAQQVSSGSYTWSHFVVSSFNHPLLKMIKSAMAQVRIAALIACIPQDYATLAQSLNAASINPTIECINQELVMDAHQRGLEVWVYTVDRPEDIKDCQAMGVDAIFTNYPERSRKLLRAKHTLTSQLS